MKRIDPAAVAQVFIDGVLKLDINDFFRYPNTGCVATAAAIVEGFRIEDLNKELQLFPMNPMTKYLLSKGYDRNYIEGISLFWQSPERKIGRQDRNKVLHILQQAGVKGEYPYENCMSDTGDEIC